MTGERLFLVAGAAIAVLLQLIVAPYIAVFSVVPNIVLAYAMVVSIMRPHDAGCVLPFVLGLAFDLFGGGPVGAMAFALTLFCFLLARYCEHAANDSLFMSIAFIALGILLVEFTYGVLIIMFGYSISFFEALAYRIAPCFLYDLLVALALLPLVRRFIQPASVVRTDITQLR